ncbi:R3H-associated N-terminal domain-containing protein [Lineolata rhizophorae]|uniref:R3H-associated N-terminal domain-containing protein n=1 Tax=Lineolata rhizophorae TaxID=578093 RepID=A0A6A6NYD8_9PEZI|nr:R3H-associated N-terminal domain-containing protein [Lineolata rhizophorae]
MMAIQGLSEPGAEPQLAAPSIEAWTEHTIQAVGNLTVSPQATPQRTTVSLDIPLDGHLDAPEPRPAYYRRREPSRRDSLQRRDALLRGKEGSRRRQRWENDQLLNNPHAQPPLPSDWEIRPTHPIHRVPYFLAPLWDAEFAARSAARRAKAEKAKDRSRTAVASVPKELRDKLKKAKGAKWLLRDLEEDVRGFIEGWQYGKTLAEPDGMDDTDSEDEIVFVGRDGHMSDVRLSPSPRGRVQTNMLVFDSAADDHGASFGRWLVHSIGTYYGLQTWSVTVGNPARREAYVGIGDPRSKSCRDLIESKPLPRPLWGQV